ncbi:MAG: hypothetical protein AB3N14_14970 [Flavobacteriaceae bacterium]
MQTLAKYFVALILFIFTYFSEKDSPKEQLSENTFEEQMQPVEGLACKSFTENKSIS